MSDRGLSRPSRERAALVHRCSRESRGSGISHGSRRASLKEMLLFGGKLRHTISLLVEKSLGMSRFGVSSRQGLT
jgi:hypothetical protein